METSEGVTFKVGKVWGGFVAEVGLLESLKKKE